ncbi:apical junction component 1 homolog [Tachysurus fulvidraco]|uniref:apical junction component 1 homolog n=1 Tax=Tachysurus fulvidraco TaxID=1234273 RepID=UPI001FEFB43E|nr:apical junction component 1 homolog [Tachysurus fulvidraco]
MTITDPTNILESAVYQTAKLNSIYIHIKLYSCYKQCDSKYISALEDFWNNQNEHSHMFDAASLHNPKYNKIDMEYPWISDDRFIANPDDAWNVLAQHKRHKLHRFSSPDLYNLQVTPQVLTAEMAGEVALRRRTRSRSASRVQTNFIPLITDSSPPELRRNPRSPKHSQCRQEFSARDTFYGPTYTVLNEVHPIKLQPQRTDTIRHSPFYMPEGLDEGRTVKLATSPHVKCRVDIKPDEAALQQRGQKSSITKMDIPSHRYTSNGSQGLTVPPHGTTFRTPTPTEYFKCEYTPTYQYSQSMPTSYMLPLKTPPHRIPSQWEMRPYGRERRAKSNPNVPTKFSKVDNLGKYESSPSKRTYYQDDYFTIPSQSFSPKLHYFQDKKTHVVHTIPDRPYITEGDLYNTDPAQYIIQTPPARTLIEDDPRTHQVQTVPPRIFYVGDPFVPAMESYIPAQVYYTEDRHHTHMVQPKSNDFYGSDVSGFSTPYPSYTPNVTLAKVRQESMSTPWYSNLCMETRSVTDSRTHSRSWDNILNTHVAQEQPVSHGKSDENLLYQRRQTSINDRPKPVVVNLSSSPRRYAALSLSDNSLIEKNPVDTKRTSSKHWYVTPEITITDNDIKPCKGYKAEVRSASWDVLDSKIVPDEDAAYLETIPLSTKDKTYHSTSLQQSLEQLDKLLADLVVDYKHPSSIQASEAVMDQFKHIDEEAVASGRKTSKLVYESSMSCDKPSISITTDPHTIRDTEVRCDGLQNNKDCSPDQSPDEDETMMCSNNKCRRTETLFNACLYFKSCHSCYTYYCSRNCRREDWAIHKESCLYGRIGSICRHIIKYCRETSDVHKAFSRIAKVGYLSRGKGVLFLSFPNPGSSTNFLQYGLESLLMSPTYLSIRELDSYMDNLGDYCKELQDAGKDYDPNECFLLNVSIAVGEVPERSQPRVKAPTVRKYAKVALASYSPERSVHGKEHEMETLILTPPPGTADIDKEGEEGRKAREICFINIQRELRIRGVFLRHEYPHVYQKLCEFVESNRRFTPTSIYPIDKRTGKQFMCMIMAASEPRTLDWVATPHLLDDII